jgi:single-strand DNA-binding protein
MDLRNRLRLYGNCGKAPQLRFNNSGDGSPVTSFRLAVDDSGGHGGEKTTTWFTVECWGNTAERACELISDGVYVTVEGKLRVEEWTDKDGRSRYTLVVAQADFLCHGKRAASDPPA